MKKKTYKVDELQKIGGSFYILVPSQYLKDADIEAVGPYAVTIESESMPEESQPEHA